MTEEKFAGIVERLEVLAQKNPRQYRFRVGALAGIGLSYYLLIMVMAILATPLFAAFAMGFIGSRQLPTVAIIAIILMGMVLLGACYKIIQGLLLRSAPPTGIELTRENAPDFHYLLYELQLKLGVPAIKKVLLTDDYNATIANNSKFFPGGPSHNILTVGLPIMDALTVDQFRSILGHELGHLSGRFGRFSNWVTGVRELYVSIQQGLKDANRSDFLIRGMVKSYVPYCDAYTFYLMRDLEYHADIASAEVSSPRMAGEALVSIYSITIGLDNAF